jgi:hypothetical protein
MIRRASRAAASAMQAARNAPCPPTSAARRAASTADHSATATISPTRCQPSSHASQVGARWAPSESCPAPWRASSARTESALTKVDRARGITHVSPPPSSATDRARLASSMARSSCRRWWSRLPGSRKTDACASASARAAAASRSRAAASSGVVMSGIVVVGTWSRPTRRAQKRLPIASGCDH